MRRVYSVLVLGSLAAVLVAGRRAGDPGTIEGSVNNLQGTGIAGAKVRGPSQLEATTNAHGVYRLDNVGAGEVTLTAGAPGYHAATLTVRVVDDSSTQASFVLKPDSLPDRR